MTEKTLGQKLKHLVECDKQLASLNTNVANREKAIKDKQLQTKQFIESLTSLKNQVLSCKKQADFLQLQLNELSAHEERKRNVLDNIQGQKEYKALEREISMLTLQRGKIENDLITALYAVETAQKAYDTALTTQNTVTTELEQFITDQEESIKTDHFQIDSLMLERTNAAAQVPQEWIQRYEQMKHHVDDPIVPASVSSCSACFYTILRQDLAHLKTQGVLPCRNCYRFLYYDAEATADQTANA